MLLAYIDLSDLIIVLKKDFLMLEKKLLFAPGPVLTNQRVKNAALEPDICHRRPVFENVYGNVRKKLLKLFHAPEDEYTVVVISGSGTSSNESVLTSTVEDGKKVLLITNGEFGNRLKNIIKCYGLGLKIVEFDWAEYPDIERIENELKTDKDISMISMVYHETSTGMINPVHEVGELARRYNKLFHVDAISAIGGEDVNVKRDSIDFCTGVPNKAVGGQPGVAFICVKKDAYKRIEKSVPCRNVYLNLQHHVEEAEKHNQTPNTPSVVIFITLNEALNVLFKEGQEKVIERYKENALIIRNGLKELKLKLLLEDERVMSNTVTSAFLPEKIGIDDFINKMEEEGYVLYKGKGPLLKKNLFQVANMGQIFPKDCENFIEVLGKYFI